MPTDNNSTDVLKDKRPVPQLIRHRWSSTEMANLGDLISNIGHTISASAGRLQRWEHESNVVDGSNKESNESQRAGINMRSASAWNDSVELLCSLSWHMRNKVNKKVGLQQGNTSEDEVDTLQTQLVVLVDAKKNSPDPETASFLQGKIVSLRQRIDATLKAAQSDDSFDYFTPAKIDLRASLNENDDIDSLKGFSLRHDNVAINRMYEETQDVDCSYMFGEVGVTKLTEAIDRLKAANVLKIYQLLNMPLVKIREIVGEPEHTDAGELALIEVLKEVLRSYGFKRRTDGNPRFDLPVGRFPFSIAAYQTRSERQAGTVFSKRTDKGLSVEAIVLRDNIKYILENAHNIGIIADKKEHIYGDKELEQWFHVVTVLLEKFKGIIPERLWHIQITEKLNVTNQTDGPTWGSYNRFVSRLVNAVNASLEQEQRINGNSIIPAELKTEYKNNDIYANRYYVRSDRPIEPTLVDQPLSCRELVQVITHIIFEWIKSVEMNMLLQRVTPDEDWLCFDKGKDKQPKKWVWNRPLLTNGFEPLAWDLREIGPKGEGYFEFAAPKVLGHHLEYEKA